MNELVFFSKEIKGILSLCFSEVVMLYFFHHHSCRFYWNEMVDLFSQHMKGNLRERKIEKLGFSANNYQFLKLARTFAL